jgi:hypothetical protein
MPSVSRTALLLAGAQLLVLALTLAASRAASGHVGVALVTALAGVNGAIVAVGLMGVRRDGWGPWALALLTLTITVGLLFWPAWDIASRAPRWF